MNVHENCPIFNTPPPRLSIYVQSSSTPLTLDVQFQANPPPSSNDNQSIKRKHSPRMTIQGFPFFLPGDGNMRSDFDHLNLFQS